MKPKPLLPLLLGLENSRAIGRCGARPAPAGLAGAGVREREAAGLQLELHRRREGSGSAAAGGGGGKVGGFGGRCGSGSSDDGAQLEVRGDGGEVELCGAVPQELDMWRSERKDERMRKTERLSMAERAKHALTEIN